MPTSPEPLEARIAPAITIIHPIPDLVPAIGAGGATLDLGAALDPAASFRTHLQFTTSYVDPLNPTTPQVIEVELFDDKAPVTVGNFLRYVNGLAPSDFNGVLFHRAIAGFVLQAGGFDATSPGEHIAIGPEIHNEFTPGDAERSNLAGTLAMAKTPLGPHTATSEWFFNLADNSSNLDQQNGGFTVFGKVTRGMDVVNAIAGLTSYNFSGTEDQTEQPIGAINSAFTDLPLQGYHPDPDGNPQTPAPTPSAAQYVGIISASVIPPAAADAGGATFSVVAVTDAVSQAPTNLVVPVITGQRLDLFFQQGASGAAKVSLKISKPGEPDAFEDFTVTLKPNLIAGVVNDTLPGLLIPGDKGGISFALTNSGTAPLNGRFDIKFYFSQATQNDPNATLLGPEDVKIGELLDQRVQLQSGASVNLSGNVAIPPVLVPVQGQNYRILVDVQPVVGAGAGELFTDDNTALNDPAHLLFNAAGTFNAAGLSRTNAVLSYTDSGNHLVKVKIDGAGYAQFDPQGNGSLRTLLIGATNDKSAITFKTQRGAGHTALDGVVITDSIAAVNFGNVDLFGDFTAQRGVGQLVLGSVGNGAATHNVTLSAATDPLLQAEISLGVVRDISLTSAQPIGTLSAIDWLDSNRSNEAITTPSLRALKIVGDVSHKGSFQADLSVTGTGRVKSIVVTGTVSSAKLTTAGDVGAVRFGAMIESELLVGLTSVPAQLGDFAANARTLGSFTVLDTNPTGAGFASSHVAASSIGIVRITNIDPSGGAADFGLIADRIADYTRGSKHLKQLDPTGDFDRRTKYVVRIV